MPKNDKIPLNRITYVEEIELDGIKYVRKDTTARMQRIKQARAGAISSTIAYMRVARSKMCLKDRAILLNEINLLERDLKKLEE